MEMFGCGPKWSVGMPLKLNLFTKYSGKQFRENETHTTNHGL